MRMRIGQDSCRCTVLTEHVQYLVGITTFLRSGVQLSIAICTGTTLAKTVVALCVHLLRTAYVGQVFLSVVHVLTALQHYRAQSQFYQSQCGKQSARSGAYHYHLWFALHVRILSVLVFIILRLLVHICTNLKVYVYLSLSGVNASLQYPHTTYLIGADTILIAKIGFQSILLCRHFRLYSYLIFINHGAKVQKLSQITQIYP